MAKIIEWNEKQQNEWDNWVSSQPKIVQDLCSRFPPYNLYLLKNSGHKVTLYSYSEDGTMTVNVSGEYNTVVFDRQAFGIKPDDLEECYLPDISEPIGTLLTESEDVEEFIDEVRPIILADRN